MKVPDAPSGPTAEEIAAEEQYRKDWPEHAAREDRLKVQLEEVKALLTTTTEALKGQIAPIVDANNVSAEEKFMNTITSVHSDALALVPKVVEWIATQPKFLQPHYNAVLDGGAAADVVELLTMFKKATGMQPTNEPDPEIAEQARLEAERAERLNKMKTPTSIRTSVTAEEDPDDFDAAFDVEAKKLRLVV